MKIIVEHTPNTGKGNALIIGIDPGTLTCGYAVINAAEPPALTAHGTLRLRKEKPIYQRVQDLYRELRTLIDEWKPEAIAIEEPVVGINSARSSLAVGQAHAAAVIAAGEAGIPLTLHGPTKVKLNATGSGRARKKDVRIAMTAMFNLEKEPGADAADAMAVAICHLNEKRLEQLELTE